MSPKLLISLFQWSDDEREANGYAFSATISSGQTGMMLVNMTDNNYDEDLHWCMEAQEKTFKAQQVALDKIQQILTQLLNNQNNDDTTGSNLNEEEHPNTDPPEIEKSKGSSIMDVDVIKGIQAQIASLTQRDQLKKVGIRHPYLLEWDSASYPPKFKPPTAHTYDGKSSSNQHIYYFRSQTRNMIDNDVVMARLFIGTLKGIAFD